MKQQRNWWERRNNLERILIVIITLLLCFVLSIFIVLIVHFNRVLENDTDVIYSCTAPKITNVIENQNSELRLNVCMIPACIRAAAQIIDLVQVSVNPCDHFHDFTCSIFHKRWKERNEFDGLQMMETIVKNRINALITEPTNEHLAKPLEIERKFYQTCMNVTAIEDNQNDAILNLIEVLGGWPVTRERFWNSRKFHWVTAMVTCRRLGMDFNYFLELSKKEVTINGSTFTLLSIKPPSLIYMPTHLQEDYLKLIINISLVLGAAHYTYAEAEFRRALNFEGEIKNLSANKEDYSDTLLQVKTLEEKFRTIPWIEFLNNISLTSAPFHNNSWVEVRAIQYLSNLITLLDKTPKSIQANYIIWKIIENYRNYMTETVRDLYDSFLARSHLGRTLTDRKSFCLSKAKFYFPSVPEAVHFRSYVRQQTTSHITQILENIKNQLQNKIETNDWPDDKFKITASKMLVQLLQEVKDFENLLYSENFESTVGMETLDLRSDNIVDMDSQLAARTMDKYFRNINRNISEKNGNNSTNNILNISLEDKSLNKILIWYTFILEQMAFHSRSPYYVSYGSVGTAIGSELIRLLFQRCKVNTTDISQSHDIEKYEKRSKCLLDQYNPADLDILTIDQRKAAADNLAADLIGADLAYKAYEEWVKQHGQEQTLPGVPYNQSQTFWIMFGISKCHQLMSVPSSSVTSSTQNSPDFLAAFNCHVDMKSRKKCPIL